MTIRIKNASAELKRSVVSSLDDVSTLAQGGKERLKSKFGEHKEESFFIRDPRLLRTIFDSPKPRESKSVESPEKNPPEPHQVKEIKESKLEEEIEPPRSPSERKRASSVSRDGSSSNSFKKGHRRTSSETNSIIAPLAKAHSSPSVSRGSLFGSLPQSIMRQNKYDFKGKCFISKMIKLVSHNEEQNRLPSQHTIARSRESK
jgi:hypothetical protein